MEGRKTLRAKIKSIRTALRKIPNVRLQAERLRWSYVQALLARGDRRVAALLKTLHACGGNWSQAFKQAPFDPDFYVTRQRPLEESLPWSFIDHGLRKRFLVNEYRRAKKAKTSPDCPLEDCKVCRICREVPV